MSQEYILSIVLVLGGILKAFGVETSIFASSLILFAIFAQALWLIIREFTGNGLVGESGHFTHNATVSLGRTLQLVG